MKTRIGFVSNSSSASFVIVWRDKSRQIEDVKEALIELFDFLVVGDFDISKSDWDTLDINSKDEFKYLNGSLFLDAWEIFKHTTKVKDGAFETRFFTTMYNDIDDFGTAVKSLLTALTIKRQWEILYINLDSDND